MKLLPKFGVEFHQRKLRNGADVTLFYRKGMPIFLRAVFFAGSRFDPIPGTAHFLEHMLVAGTEKFPSKNLIAEHIQRFGGDFGASTNNSFLRFNIEIPEAGDMKIGIEVLNECLAHSRFDSKTIEMERGSIISELNAKKTNPNQNLIDVFSHISFQGTTLGNSTLGSEENVRSITKETLLDFKDKYLHSGNVSFVVSGDIDIDTLTTLLDTVELKKGERFNIEENLPVILERKREVENYPGMAQLQVMYGTRVAFDSFKEYCALRLLNLILADGRGSRLMTKLRYENGFVYNVSGQVLKSLDWAQLRIRFSCNKENLEKALGLIKQEFDNLKNNNISSSELENAKNKISKGSVRDLQTSESWVNAHEIDMISNPNSIYTIEEYIKQTDALTLSDISFVIAKYLDPDKFCVAICGDY